VNAADTAAIFSTADHGVKARVNGGAEIDVIFDRDASITLGVDTHTAAVTCATRHGLKANDFIVIGSSIYKTVSRLSGDNDVESWQVQAQ